MTCADAELVAMGRTGFETVCERVEEVGVFNVESYAAAVFLLASMEPNVLRIATEL